LWKVHPILAEDCQTKEGFQKLFDKQYGDNPLVELLEIGTPYIEHGCGYGPVTPCVFLYEDGTKKEHCLITYFRTIEGKESCVIAGSWSVPKTIP
jgi:hypothetical protein